MRSHTMHSSPCREGGARALIRVRALPPSFAYYTPVLIVELMLTIEKSAAFISNPLKVNYTQDHEVPSTEKDGFFLKIFSTT